jgi:hypothetical protein
MLQVTPGMFQGRVHSPRTRLSLNALVLRAIRLAEGGLMSR